MGKCEYNEIVTLLQDEFYYILSRLGRKNKRCFYIHVSDLMYPLKNGYTAMQALIISRYMDTLLWRKGQNPIWHINISKYDPFVQNHKEEFCRQYIEFLENIDNSGYNPQLSDFPVRHNPFWGLHDGSHRLGYLLSICPQIFIPITMYPYKKRQDLGENGYKFLVDSGLSDAEICTCNDVYSSLRNKMRCELTAWFVFDENFKRKKELILSEFQQLGNIVKVKENINTKMSVKKICLINFTLKYQDFYYKKINYNRELSILYARI